MIGRTGGVALLEKAFATDDYSKEDLQYVADVFGRMKKGSQFMFMYQKADRRRIGYLANQKKENK